MRQEPSHFRYFVCFDYYKYRCIRVDYAYSTRVRVKLTNWSRKMHADKVTQLPTPEDVQQAKESSRTLSRYAAMDRVQMTLKGSGGETDELILPGQVMQVLLDVLAEMSKGNAISLIPRHQEISTQEAADLLNVSRPFLVGLLEKGDIPFRKVGSHRRVLLTDVLTYKERTEQQRYHALEELADLSQRQNMGY